MGPLMPVSNVPTPGSPIRSNWAISVSNVANANEAAIPGKVAKAGDNMSGVLSVGNTDPLTNNLPGIVLRPTGRYEQSCQTASVANLVLHRAGSGVIDPGQPFISFWRGTTTPAIGSITIATATSVAYNTTSDARLKERTADVADAAEIVRALGALAYRGRWIADEGAGEEWVFVNSQDVEPVAPFAVFGAPDAVATADDVAAGRAGEVGEIVPQQLDHGALVPLLLAAVSQLTARVEQLEVGR
jgi:hypothetical protein